MPAYTIINNPDFAVKIVRDMGMMKSHFGLYKGEICRVKRKKIRNRYRTSVYYIDAVIWGDAPLHGELCELMLSDEDVKEVPIPIE